MNVNVNTQVNVNANVDINVNVLTRLSQKFFESCGGVRKGESFAKVAILQYSASTGNGGQDPFLSTLLGRTVLTHQ